MVLLLMVPVVVVVAAVHSVLQRYAPSNVLAARIRTRATAPWNRHSPCGDGSGARRRCPSPRHVGGDRWTRLAELVVLVAIWDAFKFVSLGASR